MKRFKVEDRAEFEARQMPLFDFVTNLAIKAARDVAQYIKASVAPWWKGFQKRMASAMKKPNQLVLELDSIAQMPLFR
ncbi:hypothetical protein [Azonexus sp. R2A61]|uniref:hypothetical protein n=1 Tax=Azonexus sp. R2A61 TaxID=2744443 RepID=UPI001F39B618|nr:hypothetical protein [Azonexus sp. R2A61]